MSTVRSLIRRNAFLSKVIQCMEMISPLCLADKSFDNVGLLLESPLPPWHDESASGHLNLTNVLLTIDLTLPVLQESIEKKCSVIVAYHPPIFTPVKRLTLDSIKDTIILQCVSQGISIYSPHTSLDATKDGINDWIASAIGPGSSKAIQPYQDDAGIVNEAIGAGRILTLSHPMSIANIIQSLKTLFGTPYARLALANGQLTSSSFIKTIAICAGSGGSLFNSVKEPVDLFVTGEMSHHQIVGMVAKHSSVLLFEHTHTERGYLQSVLKPKLSSALAHLGEYESGSFNMFVSDKDADPLQCV